MMYTKKILLLVCTLSLSTAATFAQEIELFSSDGTLSARGELVDFANQKYTIDTSIGRMTFDTNTMSCQGDGCPAIEPLVSDSGSVVTEFGPQVSKFSIVSMGTQAGGIMRGLLPAYAQSLGSQLNRPADGAYVLTNSANEAIANISLSDTSSVDSLPALLKQQAAIALTSQTLSSEKATEINSEQQIDQASYYDHVIGLSALTIITAKDNPIDAISISDVAKVFSGQITNWSELNGQDAPIILYGTQKESELTNSFETQILNTQRDKNIQLSPDISYVENVAEQVSSNPNGIGYSYYSNLQIVKTLDIQGLCGMATPANFFTIKSEEYPLTQRFYAHHSAQVDIEHIDTLMSFMQSDAGQEIVSWYGLINQRDTNDSITNQGVRLVNAIASIATSAETESLREMVSQIIDSKRLSTTFRFETGSDQLDQRAKSDLIRLAEKLRSPENRNSVVHLLGFTDSIGNFELNQEVSLRRANQIRDALIEFDSGLAERVSIVAAGFGEIAPLVCNENAQGRSINRRVEVWMN